MEWVFTIDGTRVEAPTNWREFSTIIERDFPRKAIFYKTGADLIFAYKAKDYASGYTVLETVYNTGYCERSTFTVEYRVSPTTLLATAFTGYIYMTELRWGDGTIDEGSIVTATIQDNSWQSMIRNNASVKISPLAIKNKYLTGIAPAASEAIDFFDTVTGNYTYLNVLCWKVYDLFDYMIRFMTDGAMTVTSTLFEPLVSYWGNLYITTGQNIRSANGLSSVAMTRPVISFEDLFSEMDKILNIGMTFTSTVVNIETYADTFGTATSVSLTDLKTFMRRADTNRLFSKVIMGSEPQRWHADGGVTFPDIKYFTHKASFKDGTPEEYYTTATCNFDTALDLKGKWVRDTDVIEDILTNNNDEYDGDYFIIQADNATLQATRFFLQSGEFYYNGDLLNNEIAPRMVGLLGEPIAFFDGQGDQSFEAQKIVTEDSSILPNPTVELEFSDVISDPGTNYDNTGSNSRYIIPFDGYYRCGTVIQLKNVVANTLGGSFDINMRLRDSVGALIDTRTIQYQFVPGNPNFLQNGDHDLVYEPSGFYCNATDYISIDIAWATMTFLIAGTDTYPAPTSLFYSIQAFGDDGVFESFTAVRTELVSTDEVPLSLSDFETIKAASADKVGLNSFVGNVERLEYFYAQQTANIEISV